MSLPKNSTVHEDNQEQIEMANKAYENLVKCFSQEVDAASQLFSNDDTASRLRGVLLGRSWGETASVNDLIMGRLQHDIGYTQILVKVNEQILVQIPSFPTMNNTEIMNLLCQVVENLLKGYTDTERLKFSYGSREINRRVINAFFNVGKRKNLTMREVGIPYVTCRKMITQCLIWSTNKNSVTPVMAEMAHCKFVSDNYGKKSPIIKLKDATAEFGDLVRSLMSHGHVDVTLGFTDINVVQNYAAASRPNVTVHNVCTNKQEEDLLFQVVVVHNVVSPVFMDKWIRRMNDLPFLAGKGGRSNAYIRNASTTESPSPIIIGGKHVYASVTPDLVENQLLEICIHLADQQRKMIETKC